MSNRSRYYVLIVLLALPVLLVTVSLTVDGKGERPTSNAVSAVQQGSTSAPPATAVQTLWTIPTDRIRHQSGSGYAVTLPNVLTAIPSDSHDRNASRLVVLEDGRVLGPAHTEHAVIRSKGMGRFSHWHSSIVFSSSDNTDPTTNGRTYSVGLRPRASYEYDDPRVPSFPEFAESLPAPRLEIDVSTLRDNPARPTFRVRDPDASLLYFFELDVSPAFDSRDVHRRPRIGVTFDGANPMYVMDRAPDFSPSFTSPYRLGVLAPLGSPIETNRSVRVLAYRLGFGLPTGRKEIEEIYSYVTRQFYAGDYDNRLRSVPATMLRDRGECGSIAFVACELLHALGYSTRRVDLKIPRLKRFNAMGLGGHSAAEVFFDGSWSVFDTYYEFYIPGVSFADLAHPSMQESYFARYLSPRGSFAAMSEEERRISLHDYAQIRAYDQFEPVSLVRADDLDSPSEEAKLFAAEPVFVPDGSFETLWRNVDDLKVYVRVRGLRLTHDQLTYSATNTNPKRAAPAVIEATPWAEIDYTFNLREAYGINDTEEDSGESTDR